MVAMILTFGWDVGLAQNDEQSIGYSPRDVQDFDPCPSRVPHRYEFEVYALDTKPDPATKNREGLERAMKGHISRQGQMRRLLQPIR
jgi:phosphatidylethanolamine-binding protein (PEBP) family uncharacterized protein